MIATYKKGRWTAFISPNVVARYTFVPEDGDEEHVCFVCYDGDGDLPNPQTVIGWTPKNMWKSMIEYVNERHAADLIEK